MNGKYDTARDAFGDGTLSWTKDRIVAQLVSAQYLYSARHRDARDLRGLVGEAVELSGKSIAAGWVKASSLVFRQVSGPEVVALVIRRQADEEMRKTLIVYLGDVDRFPIKPNGGDIQVDIPSGGIFRV